MGSHRVRHDWSDLAAVAASSCSGAIIEEEYPFSIGTFVEIKTQLYTLSGSGRSCLNSETGCLFEMNDSCLLSKINNINQIEYFYNQNYKWIIRFPGEYLNKW